MDPFDLNGSTKTIETCLGLTGVKVILARQECATQARRRGLRKGTVLLDKEKCKLCKQCLILTGCPALSLGEGSITLDSRACYGCGLCTEVCREQALRKNETNNKV